MENNYFRIADLNVCIRFADGQTNDMSLLPAFKVFRSDEAASDELFFTLLVDDNVRPVKDRQLVRKFDTGNGDTVVYQLPDGGYQYIIRDIYDRDCCLLVCNADFTSCRCALNGDYTMRSFGLNDALMLVFAFAGAFRQTLLIHASCVSYQGYGYPFIAKSGTGKSTHTSLWLKHIEGSELMNDDNPVVRLVDGTPYIYGSPWSGKTPCYKDVKAPLGAVTRIDRSLVNSVDRLGPVEAFASLLPACSSMKWDSELYRHQCDTVTAIIETTPIYTLHCRPDEEAARVCHRMIVR